MKARRACGLTLVELLVVAALLAVVFGAVTTLWVNANRTTSVTGDLADAQRGARTAMARFELDALGAQGFTVVQGRDDAGLPVDCAIEDCSVLNDDVSFEAILRDDDVFSDVWYYVDNDGFLVREVDGSAARLVPNVEFLQVTLATGEYIELQITTVVDERSAELIAGVAHRN